MFYTIRTLNGKSVDFNEVLAKSPSDNKTEAPAADLEVILDEAIAEILQNDASAVDLEEVLKKLPKRSQKKRFQQLTLLKFIKSSQKELMRQFCLAV